MTNAMLLADPATVLTSGIHELLLDEIALVGGSASDLEHCLGIVELDVAWMLHGTFHSFAVGFCNFVKHATDHLIGVGHP